MNSICKSYTNILRQTDTYSLYLCYTQIETKKQIPIQKIIPEQQLKAPLTLDRRLAHRWHEAESAAASNLICCPSVKILVGNTPQI